MIDLENVGAFVSGIDEWIVDAEHLADNVYRGLVSEVFAFCVTGTPEWTGNLAASWRLGVGAPITGYTESSYKRESFGLPLQPEPYNRRQPNYGAFRLAYALAAPQLPVLHIGVDAYITNTAPYAEAVEQGKAGRNGVRAVNRPIEMVHAAESKFSKLGVMSVGDIMRMSRFSL